MTKLESTFKLKQQIFWK